MNFVKSTATAVALSMAALTLPAGIDTAEAGRVVKKKVVVNKYYPRGRYYGWRHHHHGYGGAVAAGVLGGLVAGAVVGSAIASQPKVVYVAPEGRGEEWYAYCSSKYRSFDAESGTFLGSDGYRHPCR